MDTGEIQLKYINRRSVLKYIRRNEIVTKTSLAEATGLTFSAVKKILDELEKLKLVQCGKMHSDCVGRNSVTYALNADYRFAVGIYINRKNTSVAIVNLGGKILFREDINFDYGGITQQKFVESVIHTVVQLIERSGLNREEILGVGVGVPGPIDVERGMALTPPNMPILNYLPLKEILESGLNMPVYVHKDTNVIALGEYWHGTSEKVSDLVYVDIDMGIGSGIVIDGNISAGAEGKGGEFGHMTIDLNGPVCKCGNKGCLETMASGLGIIRMMEQELENTPEHFLYPKRHELHISDVLDAYDANDMLTISIINKSAFYVGVGIANIINFFDPERIVLGGVIIRRVHNYLSIVKNVANQRMLKNTGMDNIKISGLGDDAGVIGAAEIVTDTFYHNTVNSILGKNG